MSGGYRCSLGHTWAHAGPAPDTCPVCGDTVLAALDPTEVHVQPLAETQVYDPRERQAQPEYVMIAEGSRAGSKDATLPPDSPELHAPPASDSIPPLPVPGPSGPVTPRPYPVSDSSFSSLVGMPASPDGPTAAADLPSGTDASDVVPFGNLTTDYTPPLVPGYEILHEVGRGGMGVVYKARQLSLNRPVALKMILSGSHAGENERERFRREAEAVAALQNPHIVQIFEIGESNGHLYLALEFVDGGSLAQHLADGPWPARDAAELIELIARAVQFAHDHDIVHRDLKPGNILLVGARGREIGARGREIGARGKGHGARKGLSADDAQPNWESEDGASLAPRPSPLAPITAPRPSPLAPITAPTPKITDFGLAKRLSHGDNPDGTKTGAVMGTPSYIAPEQASGKTRDVGPAADVYSLGAILYELLTGRPPFTGETALETVLQVLNDEPVPPKRLQPGVPRDLETICLKCLDKNAAKRYPSADALADDLRRFLKGETIQARPVSAWAYAVKWAGRHPSLALLAAGTILSTLALVTVLAVAYAQVRSAVEQKDLEAKSAEQAREKERRERERAEGLATEIEKRRQEAVQRNEDLRREAERTRRAAFALQLAQVAAMCERDPHRALGLLEDAARCPPDLRDFTWAYLHRLCQREDRVYTEHGANDPLHAVAYSPTGMFVATAGDGGEVRVWDPRTGRTWAVLTGNNGRIRGVAFSPDGEVVATAAADRTVRLWKLPVELLTLARRTINLLPFLQQVVRPFHLSPSVTLADAHNGEATCVAFSPDGRYLVSGGEDGVLRWWDVWGWQPTGPDLGLVGGAGAVAASLTHSRRARSPREVWLVESLDAHAKGVLSVAFASGADVLVSGGADKTAKVWAGDGSRLIRPLAGHKGTVQAVAITPDGSLVATVSNGDVPTIRIMSVDTGREVRRLIGHTRAAFAVAISPDGELLASAGADSTVRLWSLEDGLERGLLLGHNQRVDGVAFAPDRRTVVSASMDGTARVWQTGVRAFEVAEAARDLTPVAGSVSAGGGTYVVGDEQGRVQVFQSDFFPAARAAGNPFSTVSIPLTSPGRGPVRAVAASPDGRVLLASTDAAVYVWRKLFQPGRRPAVGSPLPLNRPVPLRVQHPVYGITVSPDGRWVAVRDWEGVRLWSLDAIPSGVDASNRLIDPVGPGLILNARDVRDLAFDAAGKRLAVGVGNGVQVIDLSGKLLTELPMAHDSKVEAVAFGGTDGDLLATADERGVVKVWRLEAAGLKPQAELSGHTGPVDALAFSPDGRTLASGGYDRTVVLWDPVSGQERAVLTGHTDRILCVHFLPDSSALITVGRDGTVRRWRAGGPAGEGRGRGVVGVQPRANGCKVMGSFC